MECVNHFAPGIQALMAVVIAILTGVLVYATLQYVEVSEALQKPCVTVKSEPRDHQEAIMEAPFVAQVKQAPNVEILNIVTGPALNVQYGFVQVDAPEKGPVMHPTGFVNHLQAGQQWATQLARSSVSTRNFEFYASYESLSRKKYKTKIRIESAIIKSFEFFRT